MFLFLSSSALLEQSTKSRHNYMYFNFNNNNNRWIERDNKTTNQSNHDKTD